MPPKHSPFDNTAPLTAFHQRMESLAGMARKMAHTFNNLLAGIVGYADLTKASLAPSHPAAPFVDEIDTAAKRASDFVRQLMVVASMFPPTLTPVSVTAIAAGAVAKSLPTGWPTPISIDAPADLPPILADAAQLERAFAAVVRNAIEAVESVAKPAAEPARSRGVRITTRYVPAPTTADLSGDVWPILDFPAVPAVVIDVVDDGPGFPADVGNRVVDPFVTTRPDRQGLGLAIAVGILRGHRAGMAIATDTTGGLVRLALPVAVVPSQEPSPPGDEVPTDASAVAESVADVFAEADAMAAAAAMVEMEETTSAVSSARAISTSTTRQLVPPADSGRLPATSEPTPVVPTYCGRERIVVLDGEPAISAFLRRELSRYGYTVTVVPAVVGPGIGATASIPALPALPADHSTADLIILDAALPDLDVAALLSDLGERTNHLRVLLTTSPVESQTIVAGLSRVDWIRKPFGLTELAAKIRALLDRSREFDSTS